MLNLRTSWLKAWLCGAPLGLATGLAGCGGSPQGPSEPTGGNTQYWEVVYSGTVVMADAPFAPLGGAEMSWLTCNLSGFYCTRNVFSDSLGHYSIAHSFIVHACTPGKLEVFTSSFGVLASLSGYQAEQAEKLSLTTDFCADVHLTRDFALRKLP